MNKRKNVRKKLAGDKIVQFHVLLPFTLYNDINEVAVNEGLSMGDIVRRAVRDYINRYNAKIVERASKSVGVSK